MEKKKKEVYKELLKMVEEGGKLPPKDVTNIFTKSLCVPVDGNNVIWDRKFNEFQKYGEHLSYLKILINQQVEYWKGISSLQKETFKICQKNFLSSKINEESFKEANDKYDDIVKTYLVWKFFGDSVKDKWELLGRAIFQIRACLSTERELLKKGVSQ